MSDIFSKKKRSDIMSKVRSKGNKSTELKLIEIFKEKGVKGWRRNYKLQGKPDFVFPKLKIAVFADGCFWHGHDCRNTRPSDNKNYWEKKRGRNIARDKEVNKNLKKLGWKVIRLWECEINKRSYGKKINKLKKMIELGAAD